jgi:hypothetical protein
MLLEKLADINVSDNRDSSSSENRHIRVEMLLGREWTKIGPRIGA